MDVENALALHREGQEFIDSFAEPEQAEAKAMLLDDTEYQAAYTYLAQLGELAAAVRVTPNLADTPDTVAPHTVATDEEAADITNLLAELEHPEQQAETSKLAEQQIADIDSAHTLLEDYDKLSKTFGKQPTKKQRADLSRCLKRSFREKWTAEELADQPERLRTVLESVLCKEGIKETSRSTVLEHVTTQVADYVKATEPTTTPDVIADRFSVSFSAGLASQPLKDSLLKPYFQAGERHDAQGVLSNYERLIRGALRLSVKPEICKQAILTAGFQTELLRGKSLYSAMVQIIPRMRLDQPELYGYAASSLRALNVLRVHHEVEFENTTRGNIYAEMADEMESTLQRGSLSREQIQALQTHYGRVGLQQAAIAIEALGMDEYQQRMEAMETYTDMLNGDGALERFMQAYHEGLYDNEVLDEVPHLVDIAVDEICKTMPDMRDFLTVFTNADYEVLHELPHYVPDLSSNLSNVMRVSDHSVLRGVGGFVDSIYEALSADPEAAERLRAAGYERGMSFFESVAEMRTDEYLSDDGYVITVTVPDDTPAATDETWDTLLRYYHDRLEEGKQKISETSGQRRKSHIITDQELGLHVTIRPASEEDRRDYHSIDSLLSEFNTISDEEAKVCQAEIEVARETILLERRRFLNRRGIRFEQVEAGSHFGISIVKHPKNPQYYICTFDLQANGEQMQSAKILMNRELRFQLGDKRVRSNEKLLALNALTADLLALFMCAEALETEEGPISEEKNALVSRIAHLRLLAEGQHYSQDRWKKCLEVEGEDLEVLSRLQQLKYHTTRVSTYVQAVENDDPSKGPLLIYMSPEHSQQVA